MYGFEIQRVIVTTVVRSAFVSALDQHRCRSETTQVEIQLVDFSIEVRLLERLVNSVDAVLEPLDRFVIVVQIFITKTNVKPATARCGQRTV